MGNPSPVELSGSAIRFADSLPCNLLWKTLRGIGVPFWEKEWVAAGVGQFLSSWLGYDVEDDHPPTP